MMTVLVQHTHRPYDVLSHYYYYCYIACLLVCKMQLQFNYYSYTILLMYGIFYYFLLIGFVRCTFTT